MSTRQFKAEVSPPLSGGTPIALLGDGNILASGAVRARSLAGGAGMVGAMSVPTLLMTRTGKLLKTVLQTNLLVRQMHIPVIVNGRSASLFAQQPFNDDPLMQVAHDGSAIVVVDRRPESRWIAEAFRVTRISPSGDTLFSRQFRYVPHLIDDAAFERAVKTTARNALPPSLKGEVSEEDIRRELYRPESHAPVQALVLGEYGSIWLRCDAAVTAQMIKYLVLDGSGNVAGEAHLAEAQQIIAASSNRVWATGASSEGQPILVWYVIRRP